MTKVSKRKINRRLCQKITFVHVFFYCWFVKNFCWPGIFSIYYRKNLFKNKEQFKELWASTVQKNKEPQPQIQIKIPYKKKTKRVLIWIGLHVSTVKSDRLWMRLNLLLWFFIICTCIRTLPGMFHPGRQKFLVAENELLGVGRV